MGLKSFLSRRSKNRKLEASYRIATAIESLESRRLLAGGVSASLSGSLLTITGRPKNDNITISESGSNVIVKAGAGQIGSFATSSVKSITIDGGKGNDLLTCSLTTSSILVTISGGVGNDTIVGAGGTDFIHGNAGNDNILGNGGNDTIIGDAGRDTIDGGAGNDSILGGGDSDSLLGGEGLDTIDGSAGNDTIDGGGSADWLYGGDGVDFINGGNGNDTITGGAADDNTNGGAGKDFSLTDGTDDETGIESTSPSFVAQELPDVGLTVAGTTDAVTGKQVTITFTFTRVAADSQVSVRSEGRKGNTYTFIVDVRKNAAVATPTNVTRTVVFNLGTQDPGAKKINVFSASGQTNMTAAFTVTWIAPTG